MIVPISCPVGFIVRNFETATMLTFGSVQCDVEGIITPSRQCTPGYVCSGGVRSAVPVIGDLSTPQPCPPGLRSNSQLVWNVMCLWAGYFCAAGVLSNQTVLNDFQTPQPCIEGGYCALAASTFAGTERCPAGSYCVAGATQATVCLRCISVA